MWMLLTEGNDEKCNPDLQQNKEKKEEKKPKVLHFDIDLEELANHIPDVKTPENQGIWKSREEMSDEYVKLNQGLQVLAIYIARNINEGPEVKDNINKRIILARTILGLIVDNLAVTGYDIYGMLTEMQYDIYMRVSGKKQVLLTIAQVAQAEEEERRKQSESYIE